MLMLRLLLLPAALQEGVPPTCSRYTQVYTGCAPTPGTQTYCGNVTELYGGATVCPNGTVVIGKRFHWETSQISKLPITAGDPVATCARVCEQESTCAGFAIEASTPATCVTVNSTRYTLTRLANCPSYQYTHDPSCKPTCGSGSDALRLPPMPTTSLYQPRPAVAALAGGVRECAALCDRLPGCVGFSISNTTESLCFPTNTTSTSMTTFTPVLSYVQASQRSPTLAPSKQSGLNDNCEAFLQKICPNSLGPASCHMCTGAKQHQEQIAGCTADDVMKFCATAEVDWWITSPTDHVFEDDLSTMSQYCEQHGESDDNTGGTAHSIHWSAAAGGVDATQLVLRWPTIDATALATVIFEMSDLSATEGGASITASSMSARQVGSVFAQTPKYANEKGSGYYPDILAPIYQKTDQNDADDKFELLYFGSRNGSNGRRLSWDSGRQISNRRVAGGGGDTGVQQCQTLCKSEPTCNGFFLGAAGDCHTVNATNVAVATRLEGVSYRRKRIGLPLVANVTRSVWVDVEVPIDASPGVYTGSIVVRQLSAGTTAHIHWSDVLFRVPISLQIWPINPDCLQSQLAHFGKAYGFDPSILSQLYPSPTLSRTPAAVPKSIANFTKFMCKRHVPAEALANSWATQRPLSDIEMLLDTGLHHCQQPLFNAAFLGISNPPAAPPPDNITASYVKHALDTIAPRMEQLRAAGLLHRG